MQAGDVQRAPTQAHLLGYEVDLAVIRSGAHLDPYPIALHPLGTHARRKPPAAVILLELAVATGDRGYADAARAHLELLRAFDGRQPDAGTNNVPIRHWDGYWFGLGRIWGDTVPHHWAAQSAWVYALAGVVLGNPGYQTAAGRTCCPPCWRSTRTAERAVPTRTP